jgi:hypothetical protein
MSRHTRRLVNVGVAALLMSAWQSVDAQPGGRQVGGGIKFSSGQTVQPIFEGWTRNADGSFAMHFGYLNRNYVEELHVPIGPQNSLAPGGPDRGQPTYFYARFNRRAFSITVPSDWDKKELVWTVTTRGKAERAVAWLQPEWEIEAGPPSDAGTAKNSPPTIRIDTDPAVTLPAPLRLTAMVTDDGLPKPGTGRRGARGSENPPTFRPETAPVVPVNVPEIERPRPRVPQGLSVSWIVWRGPAGVAFEPAVGAVKDGQAVVTATFREPGDYVLRARATDSLLSTVQDVRLVVTGQPATRRP